MGAVEVAKEHIAAGDIFQVVLSQRFDLDLDAEPFDLYRVLRLVNPSPYLYFLRTEQCTVVGLLARADGAAARRGRGVAPHRRDPPARRQRGRGRATGGGAVRAPEGARRARDARRPRRATTSAGWSSFGTEHVDEFMTVERYSHVMHLTSQVSGSLAPGKGPIDVLRATLPAGTLSGAPKVRAMQIIDDLEPTKRGVYGGVVGYIDFSGNLDTAIAIRTMVVVARRACLGPGRCRASSPTAIPPRRTPSASTRRPHCSPLSPPPAGRPPPAGAVRRGKGAGPTPPRGTPPPCPPRRRAARDPRQPDAVGDAHVGRRRGRCPGFGLRGRAPRPRRAVGGARRRGGVGARRRRLPPGPVQPGRRCPRGGGVRRRAAAQPPGQARGARAGHAHRRGRLRRGHRGGLRRRGAGPAPALQAPREGRPRSRGLVVPRPAGPAGLGVGGRARRARGHPRAAVFVERRRGGRSPGRDAELPAAAVECSAGAWEALRVEAGIPAMGRELDGRTIARRRPTSSSAA